MPAVLPCRLVLACLLLACSAAAAAQEQWTVYDNSLFGYRVEVPVHLLPVQEQYPRGDGRRFRSHDGTAELSVHARWQDQDIGPCIEDPAAAPASAGIQRSQQRGQDAQGQWEQHWLSSPALCLGLTLRYPAAQAGRFSSGIARIVDSLRVY